MFRLCIAQAPADLANPGARLNWLQRVMPEIARKKADLVVLPELFACGYNIGAALADRGEAADGPTSVAMAAMAEKFDVAIHYGFAERKSGHLYNAAHCVSPNGELLGLHRKLVLPPGFEREHFTPGTGCTLFEYRGINIATLICYDAEFPEAVRHVASQGTQLVLVPTALGAQWDWVLRAMMPTRAYENGLYLAYANSAGVEHDMQFLGESLIAAPDGTEVARASAEPELLLGEIDPLRVATAQARLPYLSDRSNLNF